MKIVLLVLLIVSGVLAGAAMGQMYGPFVLLLSPIVGTFMGKGYRAWVKSL